MWNINPKATNKQDKWRFVDTNNSLVVISGNGKEEGK